MLLSYAHIRIKQSQLDFKQRNKNRSSATDGSSDMKSGTTVGRNHSSWIFTAVDSLPIKAVRKSAMTCCPESLGFFGLKSNADF